MKTNNQTLSSKRSDVATPNTSPTSLLPASPLASRNKKRRRCCATYAELVLLAFLSDVQANAHLGAEGYVSLTLFRYLLHKRRAQKEKSAAQFREGFSEEAAVSSAPTLSIEKGKTSVQASLPQTPPSTSLTQNTVYNGDRNASL